MSTPFFQQYDAIGGPNGTWVKPGGRVAAYVRSTGAQEGDDLFAMSGGLVSTIAAGVARCRAGQNDIVYVLPGHAETIATGLFTAVSGAQIIGVPNPSAPNAPTVTLSATASTIALSAANMTIAGLAIVSTVAAITGAIVVTASGVTLANNVIRLTGAMGANVSVQVTGAANFRMLENELVVDSTGTMVGITGAGSTNFLIARNFARQAQGTSGGSFSTTASTSGISGHYANNYFKTASTTTAGAGVIVLGAATITTVGNHENYGGDETAAASLLVTGA